MLQHEDPFLTAIRKVIVRRSCEGSTKVYDDDSPITYIRHAKAPLLVLQGDNDIRVPKEEAEQVVDILKKEGRTVDAHYYANEGHGFSKNARTRSMRSGGSSTSLIVTSKGHELEVIGYRL